MVFPLLKPFIKGDKFSDTQRIALYGVSEKDFEFTEIMENADLVLLTMAWNYYLKTNQLSLVLNFVKDCATLNKKVIAFNDGDFGVKVPYFKNLIVLRFSGYKSKFSKNEYTLPVFIKDPLKKYFNTEEIILRPYLSKPVIGFCGQANPSPLNAAKEIINTGFRNLKSYMGLSNNEAQQVLSTSFLRASILKTLQKSKAVEANFILRKVYRAGVKSNKDLHKTSFEFYNNLRDSDYVVCFRGAGNFSVRFYETLAMGRIPIFIDTDCSLPLDDLIDWKKHLVWVEYGERNKVAKKVMEFHNALSESELINLQLANRKLWEQNLSLKCFFKIHLENITGR